jgi:hypothetical protein
MASGLKIPVGVDKSGGAAIESSSQRELKKLLFLALSEGGDDNPFQRLGLSSDLIFRVKDASFRSLALREIQRVLAQFSDRVEIFPDEPITFNEDVSGQVECSFKYIDKESHSVQEFSTKFVR